MAKEDEEKKEVVSQQHWKESISNLMLHADKLGRSLEPQFLEERTDTENLAQLKTANSLIKSQSKTLTNSKTEPPCPTSHSATRTRCLTSPRFPLLANGAAKLPPRLVRQAGKQRPVGPPPSSCTKDGAHVWAMGFQIPSLPNNN